jgi:Ricin-type beta-trefoil lectin domain-like
VAAARGTDDSHRRVHVECSLNESDQFCRRSVIKIIQWPPSGGDNQAWTLQPASDGYVLLVARHSGKAMDVELASTDDGARVIQYTPTGGANQQWLLRPVE